MDPLSIAASASGLVAACVKISATLYSFIDDTRNVDSNVTGLCDEVLGLSRVLDAISKSWRQTPLIAVAQADPNGNLWVSVKASIDDCQKTLEKLEKELTGLQKENIFSRSFMRKPTKQIKLNMKMKDIQLFRQQVQSYTGGMQSALQMINVCLLIHGQSSQELVMRSLQDLKSQIGRVEVTIQSRDSSTDVSLADRRDNQRISQTLQRLASAAESFHSSASTVASGSTVWGGSIMGDSLSQEQYRTIQDWIPQSIEEESIASQADDRSEGTRVTSPSTEHSSNPENLTADPSAVTASGHSQASDSDSDIEQDLRNKFEELALNKIEQRDYAKAELFLRRIVANEEAKGTADGLLLIKIKIATTCCFQGRWEEAESMAIPVAMGKDRVDISAFHILHTFSIRKYQQGKMEEAARWCKRALWGKKRLLGKNDTSYHESMALLARIYDSQGDAMEAEACRSFIPSTTTIDQDPLSYLYKTISAKTSPMHQLGSKNPFNPTPQIRSTQPQLTTPPIETPPLLQTPEPVRSSFRDRLGLGVPNPRSQPNPGRVAPQQSPALETERRVPGDFGGTSADSRSPNSESPTTARPLSRPKRRLVVCIDFGTTFTGVAYCYAPDGGQEKKIEVKDTWPGAGVIRMRRIPSVIYYDALKEVCGWGPDNADAVQNTGYTKVGVDKCEWLRAYLTTGRPRMYPIRLPALPTGKTAVDVIADYLHYLKMVILSDSRAASFVPFVSPDYRGPVSEIEWCFTLPPDADTVFTEAYRSAIVQAGYVQDEDKSNLTFIKGLEACCVSALESGLIPIEGQPVVLVVKCGGGIVELMAYEVINNNPLEFREVTAASGDSCGATVLNRNFSNLLKAKIEKMNLPDGSLLKGRIYAKNIMDFEKRIKPNFRNDGLQWAVILGIDDHHIFPPQADVDYKYTIWTNQEMLECFELVTKRIAELINFQILAMQSCGKPPMYVMMTGAFSCSEHLFDLVKLSVPPHFRERVVRPEDPVSAATKGAVIAKLERGTRTTRRMYLLETLEVFKPGVDPEYYRLASLDGHERCLYSWSTVIPINTRFSPGEGRIFLLVKFVAPGEPALFEDMIYESDAQAPPYVVELGDKVAGRMTTNLTNKNPDLSFEKHQGPRGSYYRIEYDIVFKFVNPDSWSVTSVFKGEVVGKCVVKFK